MTKIHYYFTLPWSYKSKSKGVVNFSGKHINTKIFDNQMKFIKKTVIF